MQLVDKFKNILEEKYQKVFVLDENNDEYFIQIFCVDESFEGKNLLTKSREILKTLGEAQTLCHAISVKGFTPDEWETQKEN